MPAVGDLFYRYDFVHPSEDQDLRLDLIETPVVRVTPKGVFLHYDRERFICTAWEKKWAYPTREAALVDFIRRRKFEIRFLQRRLDFCTEALDQARDMLAEGRLEPVAKQKSYDFSF